MKKIICTILSLFFLSCSDKTEVKSEPPIKVLSEKENQSLVGGLAKNGLPFDNLESAEKYYFDLVKKDEIKINEFIKVNSNLNLDYSPNSLMRLEDYYIKCFVEKTEKTNYSKDDFEYIITQYVRHIYVKSNLAKWAAVENDFSEKNYELGLEFKQFGKQQRRFGLDLDKSCDVTTRDYLLEAYNTFTN